MRSLSAAALVSAHMQETGEVWLVLLTISHPSIATPLRFANNTQSVMSRGELFVAFPFEVELPSSEQDTIGEARLRIDNVDRMIVDTIRTILSPPDLKFEIVLASQPDVVEVFYDGLVLRNTTYDALIVSGGMKFEDIMSEPVSLQMTPSRFPSMS